MACFWLNQADTKINIPSTEESGAVIYYKIEVIVGNVNWYVLKRYSEFYELHSQLIGDHGISKDSLPPKKVIGNKSPEFIETRRQGLENYLRCMLNYLKATMPRVFVEFLDFHLYDIFFLLRTVSAKLFVEADTILSTTKSYIFNPLQLHAISECVKKPFPALENADKSYDLTHVMDLCLHLQNLTIEGSASKYLHSNIVINDLPFEFSSFKMLKSLKANAVGMNNVSSVGNLRSTLESMFVNSTKITSVSEILQCDVVHKSNTEHTQVWTKLREIDFRNNNIQEIDNSLCLVPNLEILTLIQNKISSINNLQGLTKLIYLNISANSLTSCDDLHTKLGNIKTLILSQNNISSLQGFGKLYSLETLDVSCNKIDDVEDVRYIGDLPCLENVVLTGNAVATTVDYRIKVLEHFGERAREICLDNERPTQPELDKVAVLRALRIVREGKAPNLNNSFM